MLDEFLINTLYATGIFLYLHSRSYRKRPVALIGLKRTYRYVVRCAIWYHLYNLKNVKNTHGGVLNLA